MTRQHKTRIIGCIYFYPFSYFTNYFNSTYNCCALHSFQVDIWLRKWLRSWFMPGNTPTKPSACSIGCSTRIEAMDWSVLYPRKVEDEYILVPIPSRRPVSFLIACWSPIIILTLTPRSSARRIVSALSCLGGSKSGKRPTNSHGFPTLSLLFSGTAYTNWK